MVQGVTEGFHGCALAYGQARRCLLLRAWCSSQVQGGVGRPREPLVLAAASLRPRSRRSSLLAPHGRDLALLGQGAFRSGAAAGCMRRHDRVGRLALAHCFGADVSRACVVRASSGVFWAMRYTSPRVGRPPEQSGGDKSRTCPVLRRRSGHTNDGSTPHHGTLRGAHFSCNAASLNMDWSSAMVVTIVGCQAARCRV